MTTKLIKMVCTHCGSDDVRADAYAEWNSTTQEWELTTTFDSGHVCEKCEGECSVDEVELTGDELKEAKAHFLALDEGWLPQDSDTALEYCESNDIEIDLTTAEVET